MEEEELIPASGNKLLKFVKANILIFGLLAAGIALLLIGLIQIFGQKEADIKFEEGSPLRQGSEGQAEIKVDIDGAVQNPGLYSLVSDARIQDALIAAGGMTAGADRKNINLAQKISDGQKIYIPEIGEETPVLGSVISANSSTDAISINSSSQSQLEELPGIGPVRASAIIDGRPYGSIEELRERGILGEKTFEGIVELISL